MDYFTEYEGNIKIRTDRDDYTFSVAGLRFGFVDTTLFGSHDTVTLTGLYLGPFGSYRTPVTAKVGWGIVILVLVLLVAVVATVLSRRRKNNSPATH